MKAFKLALLFALVIALLAPAIAIAKDSDMAGKVTSVSGKAEVKKGGGSKKFAAFKGMAIGKGDTISTGKAGKLTMDLGSDKEVVFGANTTLTVSELTKSAKSMGGKTSITLSKGSVMIKIKQKLEGDSRFEVETPTAIMGVMGTEFTVAYEGGESYVGVFEGAVSTSFGDGLSNREVVRPGEQLLIGTDGEGQVAPLEPEDLPLVALEDYTERVKDSVDAELVKKVQALLETKRAEAAKASEQQEEPRPTNIVYEKPTPAPVVTPGPTPTPSPSPSPSPSPTTSPSSSPSTSPSSSPSSSPSPTPAPSGAPEFDAEAFYGDFYSYVIDEHTIRMPFTTDVELVPNSDGNGASPVSVTLGEWCETSDGYGPCKLEVQGVQAEGNELVITLSEPMTYFDHVYVEVRAGALRNKHFPEKVQTEIQSIRMSVVIESPDEGEEYPVFEGFLFVIVTEPSAVSFNKEYPNSSGYTDVFFPSNLGIESLLFTRPFILSYFIDPELGVFEDEITELTEDDYEWVKNGNGWNLRLFDPFLIELKLGWTHGLIVPVYLGSENDAAIYIDIEVCEESENAACPAPPAEGEGV